LAISGELKIERTNEAQVRCVHSSCLLALAPACCRRWHLDDGVQYVEGSLCSRREAASWRIAPSQVQAVPYGGSHLVCLFGAAARRLRPRCCAVFDDQRVIVVAGVLAACTRTLGGTGLLVSAQATARMAWPTFTPSGCCKLTHTLHVSQRGAHSLSCSSARLAMAAFALRDGMARAAAILAQLLQQSRLYRVARFALCSLRSSAAPHTAASGASCCHT
jgi:hypothetical protein